MARRLEAPDGVNEELVTRIRTVIGGNASVTERRMFGGLSFLLHGNVFCGVIGNELMVRVGMEEYEPALSLSHVRAIKLTGRPLRGYVRVSSSAIATPGDLAGWVRRGLGYAGTLRRAER